MKHCTNHSEKAAESVCHACGQPYCAECLDEGREYFFCRKPGCHTAYREQIIIFLPKSVECPSCGELFEPSESERESRKTHCTECECFIDFNAEPPKVINPESYSLLLSSLNQGDISLIKSILDDAEISYYVVGDNFVSVRPLVEPASFFVHDDDIANARELLKDFELHIFGTSAAKFDDPQ